MGYRHVVQEQDTLVGNAEVQASIRRLVDRLGVVCVESTSRWRSIVDQLDFGSTNEQSAVLGTTPTIVVVGLPADVLKHARHATDAFGFVTPVARIANHRLSIPIARMAKPQITEPRIAGLGQQARSWRDDATLDLWHAGWAPLNIDRLLVTTRDATIEYAIGDVRLIPGVQIPNG